MTRSSAAGGELRVYRRRADATVIAICLDLVRHAGDADGAALFEYFKWGDTQRCKSGDWLVRNGDDVYTVDRETFARTYAEVRAGEYRKVARVWAERAETAGSIGTKEGTTTYAAGDYLVYNAPGRRDGYAVSAARFERLYEPDD